MEHTKTLNHNFATIGNGVLLIWWGIVIMIDPLTIGMGAIGMGVIMLGLNAVRLLSHIPTRCTTTTIGIIALVWGILDTIMVSSFELSFAIMLIVIGLVSITSLLTHGKTEE